MTAPRPTATAEVGTVGVEQPIPGLSQVPAQLDAATRHMIRFTDEQTELIKDTIAKDQRMTDPEFGLFLYVAQRRGLDPLAKQIYAIRRKGKITHQTSIDGFRTIAARTGEYAGRDRPIFEGSVVVEPSGNKPGCTAPEIAVFTVYREVKGIARAFTSEARWSEYFPTEIEMQFMYRTKPFLMLAKCAEAQALRAAFPEELGGLYIGEEMMQAGAADSRAGRNAQNASAGIEEEEAPVDPLIAAMNSVLPGEKGKAWGGNGGKTLNEIASRVLTQVARWVAKKAESGDETPELMDLMENCNLILSARQQGHLQDPGKGSAGAPPQSETPAKATEAVPADSPTPSETPETPASESTPAPEREREPGED